MKRTAILAITMLLAISASAFSQNSSTFGLDFDAGAILGNIFHADTNGTTAGVGVRFKVSDKIWIRANIGMRNFSDSDTLGLQSDMTLSLAPGLVYGLMHNGPVDGYIGAQIAFATSSRKTNLGGTNTNKISSSAIGGGVFLGAEWHAWQQISLVGEFGFNLMSNSSSSETTVGTTTTTVDVPSTTTMVLGQSGHLGVIVYL